MKQPPQTGDRITDKSAPPDERTIRSWIGPEAFASQATASFHIQAPT